MRPTIAWIFILGFHGELFSEVRGEAYWNRIKERADSVVTSRFGTAFFADHIFTPIDTFYYVRVGQSSCSWRDRDTITSTPTYCHFEYAIGFDPRHVSWLNIGLNITPDGRLVEDEDLKGFVPSGSPVVFHTDFEGFIKLGRNNGVKCNRRTAFRDLRWVPADTAQRIHSGGNGRYELVLGRIRGQKKENVSHSTHTYLVVDAIVLDPFTGAILRKEERHETLGWACGPAFL